MLGWAQGKLSFPGSGHVLQICCPLLCQGEASVAHGISCASDLAWARWGGGRMAGCEARYVWRLMLLVIRLLGGGTGGWRKMPYCGPCAQWAYCLGERSGCCLKYK